MDLAQWGFGSTTVISGLAVIMGLVNPGYFNNPLYFCIILVVFTITGALASYSLQFKHLKYLTVIICLLSTIAVLVWFLLVHYSFHIFFTIVNLCYIFVYSLFFILLPYYAAKLHAKYRVSSIRGYHIHENAYGILFIVLGLLMVFSIWWKTNIALLDFFKYHLFLYLGAAFVIVGAFLVGRDYRDLKKWRFIERTESQTDDPEFHIRVKYYRLGKLGIVFTLFGIIFLFEHNVWADLILDKTIFIILGFTFIIIGAILSGINPTYFARKTHVL